MRNFSFNQIFVVESLDDSEKKTGYELYSDILRWKPQQSGKTFKVEFNEINSRDDFFNFFDDVTSKSNNGLKPIFHFEIHGLEDKSGLILKNDEIILYAELTSLLSKVNQLIGNNLFLTLSVCHGAYLLGNVKIDKPAPFMGFIGSFEKTYNKDALVRYTEFYDEFLSNFNLGSAIQKFLDANNFGVNTYNLIETEETFKTVYKNYLTEKTTEEGIKNRWKQAIIDKNLTFVSRQEKRLKERQFRNQIIKTKQKYFIEHRDIFFMIDRFPENENRFKLPKKYEEIL